MTVSKEGPAERAQSIWYLPPMHKDLSSIPRTQILKEKKKSLGMVEHVCNPCTGEKEHSDV